MSIINAEVKRYEDAYKRASNLIVQSGYVLRYVHEPNRQLESIAVIKFVNCGATAIDNQDATNPTHAVFSQQVLERLVEIATSFRILTDKDFARYFRDHKYQIVQYDIKSCEDYMTNLNKTVEATKNMRLTGMTANGYSTKYTFTS